MKSTKKLLQQNCWNFHQTFHFSHRSVKNIPLSSQFVEFQNEKGENLFHYLSHFLKDCIVPDWKVIKKVYKLQGIRNAINFINLWSFISGLAKYIMVFRLNTDTFKYQHILALLTLILFVILCSKTFNDNTLKFWTFISTIFLGRLRTTKLLFWNESWYVLCCISLKYFGLFFGKLTLLWNMFVVIAVIVLSGLNCYWF